AARGRPPARLRTPGHSRPGVAAGAAGHQAPDQHGASFGYFPGPWLPSSLMVLTLIPLNPGPLRLPLCPPGGVGLLAWLGPRRREGAIRIARAADHAVADMALGNVDRDPPLHPQALVTL